jgi:hypothetical protein
MPTRNSEVLQSFVDYCQAHPDLRFWQALRNWSGQHFVLVADFSAFPGWDNVRDTFYWEGRNGKEI